MTVEVFMGCYQVTFSGIDDGMQFRKMPSIFLLVLKLKKSALLNCSPCFLGWSGWLSIVNIIRLVQNDKSP